MGVENIIAGDGIGIAVTGMAIVLAGLLLISLFVTALPRLVAWPGAGKRERAKVQAADAAVMGEESSIDLDPELLAAITYVVAAEREREQSMDRQRITIREDDEQRVWTAIGKMRTLSKRL